MEKQDLREEYSKIAEKYPRINFKLLDKIINFIKNHPKNNLGISVREISEEFGEKNNKIRTYCLKYAVPFNKLDIHKRGNSHQYPVLITISGSYKPVKNFDSELEEFCSLIIDFFNQNPKKLTKELRKDFERLKLSMAKGRPNIGAQEKLIVVLWEEGIPVNCATFRRTNYLFC